MRFSIRSLLVLIIVAALTFAFLRGRRPYVTYHADIRKWHSEMSAMAEGRHGLRWSDHRNQPLPNFTHYYDEDNDGKVDYRHEIQSTFVIHSHDDDRDGFFDRQRYWRRNSWLIGATEVELEIHERVPITAVDLSLE
ncbi:MAG: hypothetical protein WBD20_02815 [Pirellulaceae bacterium]